jgi:hypothetical protein
MLRGLIFVCLVAMSLEASGGEQLKFRSRYYQITTDLEKDLARRVAEHMDLVYEAYSDRFRTFPTKNPGGHPLFVFAAQGDYLGFLEKHGINGTGSGGMFFVNPTGSALATYLQGQDVERMMYTLRHEGFHQFAYNRIGELPVWVNEGLAEYFAGSIVVGKKLVPGQVRLDRLRSLRAAVEEERHVPFRDLLAMTSDRWATRVRGGEGAMQYAQSWSIVHFLAQGGPKYKQAFEQYLHLVARGTGSDQAFGRAFGLGSYEVFERKWKQYLTDLEPGPEATAAHRLEFLGRGIAWLREQGQTVDSFEQLKGELQRREFYVSDGMGDASSIQMKATDAENFEPPPAAKKDQEVSIELLPSKDEKLPPGLLVKGLKLPVRLVWEPGPEGKPISRIVYE